MVVVSTAAGIGVITIGVTTIMELNIERYIEVIGESTLVETIQEYVADINLSVRSSQPKTALDEVIALRDRCIEMLMAVGLERSALQEGKAEVWRDWFSRKQTGQETLQKKALQKIVVTCSEVGCLMKALSALELLFENPRYTFALNLHPPTFGASEELKQQARTAAIQDAYAHAKVLAAATQLNLVEVIQIEEVSKNTESSHIHGAVSPQKEEAAKLADFNIDDLNYFDFDQAIRKVKLRYRVRFAVCRDPQAL